MKSNSCCQKCLNSKYALKGKVKEKFGGVCGLVCDCHWGNESTTNLEKISSKLVNPMQQKQDWEKQLLDFVNLKYEVIEHNPYNYDDTIRTLWSGEEAKSRLQSLIDGIIHRTLSSHNSQLKKELEGMKMLLSVYETGSYIVGWNSCIEAIIKKLEV